MTDETECLRRQRLAEINAQPGSRETLEAQYGQVWTTAEMRDEFQVLGFAAPFVVVRRKSNGKKGSLEFQHNPRFYFNWEANASNGRICGLHCLANGLPSRIMFEVQYTKGFYA